MEKAQKERQLYLPLLLSRASQVQAPQSHLTVLLQMHVVATDEELV